MSEQFLNTTKDDSSNQTLERLAKISLRAAHDIKSLTEKQLFFPECRTISLIKKELISEFSQISESTNESLFRVKSARNQKLNFIPFLEERDRLGYLISKTYEREEKGFSPQHKIKKQIQSAFPSIDQNSWEYNEIDNTRNKSQRT